VRIIVIIQLHVGPFYKYLKLFTAHARTSQLRRLRVLRLTAVVSRCSVHIMALTVPIVYYIVH
jgi:hypothetical protein